MRRPLWLGSLALAAAVGCTRAPSRPYTVLLGMVDSLRTAFNADSGKVRAIFLASPT